MRAMRVFSLAGVRPDQLYSVSEHRAVRRVFTVATGVRTYVSAAARSLDAAERVRDEIRDRGLRPALHRHSAHGTRHLNAGTVAIRRRLERTRSGGLTSLPTKTRGSERRIALLAQCIRSLKEHKERQGRERGEAGAGSKDSSLVFATATLLLEQGVDLVVIKELLGHAHIGVTARVYAHIRLRLQHQAINAMGDALGPAGDSPKGPPTAAVRWRCRHRCRHRDWSLSGTFRTLRPFKGLGWRHQSRENAPNPVVGKSDQAPPTPPRRVNKPTGGPSSSRTAKKSCHPNPLFRNSSSVEYRSR